MVLLVRQQLFCKAWYLMCLLVCAVSQPLMFAAVNTRKANKMKDLFNSGVVLSTSGPIAWAVHDPEFALVSFCLETGSTAGQAQALGPWQAMSNEVLGAACCSLRACQLSTVPSMCAGQPPKNWEGRWLWINLLYQKTESQESQRPSSAKAMLM